MLQVGVEEDGMVGIAVVEPGEHRCLVAEVPGEVQHPHARLRREAVEQPGRFIARAIVDVDDRGVGALGGEV